MTKMTKQVWIALALALVAACSSHSAPAPDQAPPRSDVYGVPAAQVSVPPRDVWTARPPAEPPNPILHREPLHNPGGFNGDRPHRHAAGLGDEATPAHRLVTLDVPASGAVTSARLPGANQSASP
jgi:hypothetical protein